MTTPDPLPFRCDSLAKRSENPALRRVFFVLTLCPHASHSPFLHKPAKRRTATAGQERQADCLDNPGSRKQGH
jgi:hypothetical protein